MFGNSLSILHISRLNFNITLNKRVEFNNYKKISDNLKLQVVADEEKKEEKNLKVASDNKDKLENEIKARNNYYEFTLLDYANVNLQERVFLDMVDYSHSTVKNIKFANKNNFVRVINTELLNSKNPFSFQRHGNFKDTFKNLNSKPSISARQQLSKYVKNIVLMGAAEEMLNIIV